MPEVLPPRTAMDCDPLPAPAVNHAAVTAACVEVRREMYAEIQRGDAFTPGGAVREATRRIAARLGVALLPVTMDTFGATLGDLPEVSVDGVPYAPYPNSMSVHIAPAVGAPAPFTLGVSTLGGPDVLTTPGEK